MNETLPKPCPTSSILNLSPSISRRILFPLGHASLSTCRETTFWTQRTIVTLSQQHCGYWLSSMTICRAKKGLVIGKHQERLAVFLSKTREV
nr:hypothetical protein I308_01235 [Cryptococcus tetragattii IND107]